MVFLIPGLMIAQQTEYKVFYYSGTPLIKLKSKSESLKRDVVIDAGTTISIPQNAYVVITNKDEVPLGISKPGDYGIKEIESLYKNIGDNNLTEEFFEYIAGNMIRGDEVERKSGGVYRAVGDLMINPYDSATVISSEITFEWSNANQKTMYLKIFEIDTWELLADIPSIDSVYTIKANETGLIEGKEYAWVMAPIEGIPQSGTELLVFKIADKEYLKSFNKQLKDADKNATSDQMRKMMKLRLYIDNNIFPIPPYSEL
jgi:hypothetical protein